VLTSIPRSIAAFERLPGVRDQIIEEKTMSIKTLGYALLVVGIAGLLVSLFANSLGIGTDPGHFGWLQWVGVALGAVLTAGGAWLATRKPVKK
jgi:hypothetical protein